MENEKRKMPKTKKDPNKPKGVKSAFMFYMDAVRAGKDMRGEQVKFSEFSKECGIGWGKLTDTEKQPYMSMNEEDKIRHENEMQNYQPPPVYNSDGEEIPAKKMKKKKDPNAPKRPISAYFFFAGDVRPEIRKENPGMRITEISTLIGQQWRQLSAEDKTGYEEQAEKDKERYDREMAAYHTVVE